MYGTLMNRQGISRTIWGLHDAQAGATLEIQISSIARPGRVPWAPSIFASKSLEEVNLVRDAQEEQGMHQPAANVSAEGGEVDMATHIFQGIWSAANWRKA